MTDHDRDWATDGNPLDRFGRPGGDFHGLRPTMDNPLTWSLPLGRVAGVLIQVHIFFLVFIVIRLMLTATSQQEFGFWTEVTFLGCLFSVVLLHELGHCIACRLAGGHADEVLMWPLGGLAFGRPPMHWRAHLVTAAGGPAANVVICVALGTVLYLLTGRIGDVAVPRLFVHSYGLGLVAGPWWQTVIYLANWASLVVLMFNLLPIFPLDGGRILQALLWSRAGYTRAMRLAVWIGYAGAAALAITGLLAGPLGLSPGGVGGGAKVTLVVVAIFGALTCYVTGRQLAFTDEFMGFDAAVDARPSRPTRRERRLARRAERDRLEEVDVERILTKIADTGMDSLTGAEKRLLKRATRRKRENAP